VETAEHGAKDTGFSYSNKLLLQETVPVVFYMSAEGLVRCLLTVWGMWSYALAGFVVARSNREHRVFAELCFATTSTVGAPYDRVYFVNSRKKS
jgi:hypothetical protein